MNPMDFGVLLHPGFLYFSHHLWVEDLDLGRSSMWRLQGPTLRLSALGGREPREIVQWLVPKLASPMGSRLICEVGGEAIWMVGGRGGGVWAQRGVEEAGGQKRSRVSSFWDRRLGCGRVYRRDAGVEVAMGRKEGGCIDTRMEQGDL